MARNFTARQRLHYRFDNFMAGGTSSQLRALFVCCVVLSVVFTALLYGLGSRGGAGEADLAATFWSTSMGVLRSGTRCESS